MSTFPTALNNFVAGNTIESEEYNAIETKIGINGSAATGSLDYLLKNVASSNPGHKHTLAQGATDVTATYTELNYVSGVTSAIQTQLNTKVASTRTISTTTPLSGGGDLSADRTLSLTTVPANLGGTGVANNVASTITITGAFALGITLSAGTAVTFPTTGTLVSSVTTANGVSAVNTAGALTFTLGVIAPTSVNGLTFVAAATGFTIAGGTTSKTLTVPLDASVSGTNTGDNAANSSTMYIGTTSVALNRASAALVLTGITSIDGNAATVTGLSVTSGKTLTVSDSATIAINSITLAGGEVITFSATNALTLITTGATSVTFPTTGTLVSSVTTGNGVSATNTAGALAFTLGVITPTSVNGLTLVAAADGFTVTGGTTPRILTVTGANIALTGGGNTLTLGGNLTTSNAFITTGAFSLTLTATATTVSTLPAGTHSLAPLDTPVFTTNITSPIIIGGVGTTQTLILRSTSGAGTTGADIVLQTGNNGNVEIGRFYNSGIIDFTSQSRASAYATTQTIPNETTVRILFDTENFDSQNEFNSIVVSGTAEENGGVNLKDTGIFTQAEAYYTIMWVWNTTDNTYTTVTGKTSDDVLTLAANIFTVGETFKLYASRFTATKTGYYQVNCTLLIASVDTSYASLKLYVDNTATRDVYSDTAGAIGYTGCVLADTIYLAAGSYVDFRIYQSSGGARATIGGARYTYCSVHKLS